MLPGHLASARCLACLALRSSPHIASTAQLIGCCSSLTGCGFFINTALVMLSVYVNIWVILVSERGVKECALCASGRGVLQRCLCVGRGYEHLALQRFVCVGLGWGAGSCHRRQWRVVRWRLHVCLAGKGMHRRAVVQPQPTPCSLARPCLAILVLCSSWR